MAGSIASETLDPGPSFVRRSNAAPPTEGGVEIDVGEETGEATQNATRPSRRSKRGWLLASVALLGLLGGGFALSRYNTIFPITLSDVSATARRAAASTGLIAPAARMAQAPAPQQVPAPVRTTPPPEPPEAQRDELLRLHSSRSDVAVSARRAELVSDPARPGASRLPESLPGPPRAASPPPPNAPVSPRTDLAGPAEAPAAMPLPALPLPQTEVPIGGPARNAALPTPAAPASFAGPPAPAPAPTPTPRSDGEPAPMPRVAAPNAALAAAAPPPLLVVPPAPTRSSVAQDPASTAAALRPAPIAAPQQIEVLGLVTQMGIMVRDQRDENRQLRQDVAAMREALDSQLADFNRRLSLAEARGALSAAMGAAAPAPTAEASAAPGRPGARQAQANGPQERRRYRVQAASPGLAMLAEIDRSGEAGASLQISVGDEIPGYGRVQSIGQEGSTWIVRAERGSIQ